MTNIEYIGPTYFGMIPKDGTLNGISDGDYGYAIKNGAKKPIKHSELKKLLNETSHIDFICVWN